LRLTSVDGVVAQLVERLVRNEKVAGSIPVGSTSFLSSENSINPVLSKYLQKLPFPSATAFFDCDLGMTKRR
jgi:hypothetical protein